MMKLNGTAAYHHATVSLIALMGACGWLVPSLAQAAAADSDSTESGVQEIIVTAQKRAQRLSDVGISIVAANAEQLTSAGITDASQLANVVPGFTASTSQAGFPIYSIRGVNFNSNQISAAPTVSTYIDEAALPLPAMTGGLLLDVERVEVLKGPQGTLFGQNATGGSVNVIAAKPTSTLAVGGRAEVNNFGQVFVEGYVSGPLSDTLRVRLAGQTTQFGAWQYSPTNGIKNGDQNKGAGRLLVDWQATPTLRFNLNLNANYDHGEPQSTQFVQWNFSLPAAFGGNIYPNFNDQQPSDKIRVADIPTGFQPKNHHRQFQAVLRTEFDLDDNNKVTSITNYIDTKFRQSVNFAASFFPIFFVDNDASARTFGQELRLNGTVPSAHLTYIVGANYQNNSPVHTRFDYNLVHYSPFPLPSDASADITENNRSIGGFANLDWEFTPGLTLTGGARYTEVRERYNACGWLTDQNGADATAGVSALVRILALNLPPLPPGTFQPGVCNSMDAQAVPNNRYDQGSITEKNWSWRGGLNYKINQDSLVYALVSRGYKAGVFPAIVAPFASAYQYVNQEKLTSYEGGAKLSFLDRKLQVEFSAFYYDYADKQLYTYKRVPIFGPVATAANIPKSSVKGFDFSVRANPLQGWTLNGGVTYAKSKIKQQDSASEYYDLLNVQVASIEGNRFNFAPDWSGTVDTEYRTAASSDVDAFIGGGVRFASKSYSDLVNSSLSTMPGYAVFDVRIGLESSKGWNASLWSRNVTNERYLTNIVALADAVGQYTGMPRTFGLSFGARY